MPNIAPDHVLTDDQLAVPVMWVAGPFEIPIPDVSDDVLELAFGPGSSRKLKSWGHTGKLNAHWLVTRNGTSMHTDTNYARYTHHLVLRNDGWRIRGFDDSQLPPPLVPGTLYCLDTHSPHQVVVDERIAEGRKPIYKVQIAVDTNEPLERAEAWKALTPKLKDEPRRGAADAAKSAPAPRVKAVGT